LGHGVAVNPMRTLYSEALIIISCAMFLMLLAETYSPKVRFNDAIVDSTIQRWP